LIIAALHHTAPTRTWYV